MQDLCQTTLCKMKILYCVDYHYFVKYRIGKVGKKSSGERVWRLWKNSPPHCGIWTIYLCVCLMYCKLREGEIDALSVESSIDLLVDVEKDTPIVLALDPHTDCEIDTAIRQFGECNERCGIG